MHPKLWYLFTELKGVASQQTVAHRQSSHPPPPQSLARLHERRSYKIICHPVYAYEDTIAFITCMFHYAFLVLDP